MTKKKEFDCVEMKNRIQKKIAREIKGLSEKERRAFQKERIKSHPALKKFIEEVRIIKPGALIK